MDTSYKFSSVGQVARDAIGAGGFKLVMQGAKTVLYDLPSVETGINKVSPWSESCVTL